MMTLRLNHPDTKPANLGVKTGWFYGHRVGIGEWHAPENQIAMSDFMEACYYVLTNTDLEADDPRLEFLERIKKLEIINGWNVDNDPDSKRLGVENGKQVRG